MIEHVLDKLQNTQVYSTLDLKNEFFRADIEDNTRKYISFVVPDGQFEFTKAPFGLSISPSAFHRYGYSVLRDLMNEDIVIIYNYVNDLMIPSVDEKEALERLKIVLQV